MHFTTTNETLFCLKNQFASTARSIMCNLVNLYKIFEIDESGLEWLRGRGLIMDVPLCSVCGESMTLRKKTDRNCWVYRCHKRGAQPHDKTVQVFAKSFFANHHWSARNIMGTFRLYPPVNCVFNICLRYLSIHPTNL